MTSDPGSPIPKWVVKFTYEEPFTSLLIDLKYSDIFNKRYPVFKMELARELLDCKRRHYYHVKRDLHPVEIKDPTGKEVPEGSCLFIFATSMELGIFKALFIPQPEERFVLTALDEVWIKVIEEVPEAQRMTLITNVTASLIIKPENWSQIYLIY
jgi:hypothetical protein